MTGGALERAVEVGETASVDTAPVPGRPDDRKLDSYLAGLERNGVRVSLVIPALNEEANLSVLLPRLPARCQVVVVDGGSKDRSLDVIRRLRPDATIVLQPGRGKGDALLCGFRAASGEVIVTFDGDGSAHPAELPAFIGALIQGADFAKGSRLLANGGSADLTRLRKLGNRALTLCFNVIYGTRFTDLCYGYNAFWRHCLPHMPQMARGFEIETKIHAWIAQSRLKVVEIPSFEHARMFGTSHLRPVRDGARVMWVMVRARSLRRTAEGMAVNGWTPGDGNPAGSAYASLFEPQSQVQGMGCPPSAT